MSPPKSPTIQDYAYACRLRNQQKILARSRNKLLAKVYKINAKMAKMKAIQLAIEKEYILKAKREKEAREALKRKKERFSLKDLQAALGDELMEEFGIQQFFE